MPKLKYQGGSWPREYEGGFTHCSHVQNGTDNLGALWTYKQEQYGQGPELNCSGF